MRTYVLPLVMLFSACGGSSDKSPAEFDVTYSESATFTLSLSGAGSQTFVFPTGMSTVMNGATQNGEYVTIDAFADAATTTDAEGNELTSAGFTTGSVEFDEVPVSMDTGDQTNFAVTIDGAGLSQLFGIETYGANEVETADYTMYATQISGTATPTSFSLSMTGTFDEDDASGTQQASGQFTGTITGAPKP